MVDLDTLEPILIPTSDGGWLAIASAACEVRAGVLAATEVEARMAFRDALDRLKSALDQGSGAAA